MEEIWKDVDGYDGDYQVSDQGRVRSWKSIPPKILKHGYSSGYLNLNLSKNNKIKTKMVHILVLEAFISPRPKDYKAAHLNGLKTCNVLSNLKWVKKDYKPVNPENKFFTKLKETDIPIIRKMRRIGYSIVEITNIFNVSYNTIYDVLIGLTWTTVSENNDFKITSGRKTKLTETDVRQIRKMYEEEDFTYKELGKIFNCTHVAPIVKRTAWKHVK